jgi:gliding motility-associated-like protein
MKVIIFIPILFCTLKSLAQTTAERYTISSGGASVTTSSATYMYDIGGVVVTTATTSNSFITQGFEQSSRFIDLTDFTPPNTFSPNDDGINDGWVIPLPNQASTPVSFNVTIINRWGDRIAYIEDYNNIDRIWNGTYELSGMLVSDGTYFYIIESSDGKIKLSGWLQVVR